MLQRDCAKSCPSDLCSFFVSLANQFAICRLQYDSRGNVQDWGPSNAIREVDERYKPDPDIDIELTRVLRVPCWTLLRCSAEVRDFPKSRFSVYHGDHGWEPFADFWVADWGQIWTHFDDFYSTVGCYTRVSFRVERMHWTREEGWEYDDRI